MTEYSVLLDASLRKIYNLEIQPGRCYWVDDPDHIRPIAPSEPQRSKSYSAPETRPAYELMPILGPAALAICWPR